MSEPSDRQSPEILIHIQAAERRVERELRSAGREAATLLEKARAQAEASIAEASRALEEKKIAALNQRRKEAEREAERVVLETRVQAHELTARCQARVDEAVELVLRRVLHT